jgi:hypothetical protein
MSTQDTPRGKSTPNIIIIAIILIAAACLCILTLGLGEYFIFGDQIQDWFNIEDAGRLNISIAEDGSISGEYNFSKDAREQLVHFTVSKAGEAALYLAGDSPEEALIVKIGDESNTSLTWKGITSASNTSAVCQGMANSDCTVVMKEMNLGDCGFQVEQGYLGTPRGAPGYEGWGIQFGLEGFSVSVMTNQNYPAIETWIHLTAE